MPGKQLDSLMVREHQLDILRHLDWLFAMFRPWNTNQLLGIPRPPWRRDSTALEKQAQLAVGQVVLARIVNHLVPNEDHRSVRESPSRTKFNRLIEKRIRRPHKQQAIFGRNVLDAQLYQLIELEGGVLKTRRANEDFLGQVNGFLARASLVKLHFPVVMPRRVRIDDGEFLFRQRRIQVGQSVLLRPFLEVVIVNRISGLLRVNTVSHNSRITEHHHINPNGSDNLSNLWPLQWENNVRKSDGELDWNKNVRI